MRLRRTWGTRPRAGHNGNRSETPFDRLRAGFRLCSGQALKARRQPVEQFVNRPRLIASRLLAGRPLKVRVGLYPNGGE
jgi:hypothetical protein